MAIKHLGVGGREHGQTVGYLNCDRGGEDDGEEQQLDRQAGGLQGLQACGHGPAEAQPAPAGGQAHQHSQEHGLQVVIRQCLQ